MQDEDGLFRITRDGKTGYIDRAGEIVIEPQPWVGHDFCEGVAAVDVPSAGRGFIDRTGAFVIDPRERQAGAFSEGLAWIRLGWFGGGLLRRDGIGAGPVAARIHRP